jgi:hypothetical protein
VWRSEESGVPTPDHFYIYGTIFTGLFEISFMQKKFFKCNACAILTKLNVKCVLDFCSGGCSAAEFHS